MPKFRVKTATTVTPAPLPLGIEATLHERRARAFARVFPLLSTSIPTADIVTSYLDEVLTP